MSSNKLLVFFCVVSAFGVALCEDVIIFGQDIPGSYYAIPLSKIGIPFISREEKAVFPDDFMIGGSTVPENYVIRGIKHYNHVESEKCQNATVEIINGGINEKTATVQIKSKSGCGIDSVVGFIVKRDN